MPQDLCACIRMAYMYAMCDCLRNCTVFAIRLVFHVGAFYVFGSVMSSHDRLDVKFLPCLGVLVFVVFHGVLSVALRFSM